MSRTLKDVRLSDAVEPTSKDLLDKSASDRPLIADSAPLSVLREEYERGSGSFVQQIDFLSTNKGFTHIRKTRGDGDCFYRCKLNTSQYLRLVQTHIIKHLHSLGLVAYYTPQTKPLT